MEDLLLNSFFTMHGVECIGKQVVWLSTDFGKSIELFEG